MKKPKTIPAPKVGEFVVREAYDGRCGSRVIRKTGDRFDDVDWKGVATRCETEEGAKRLAALLNDAQVLARAWRHISSTSPSKAATPEDWVKHLIVDAVARAIGGPRPDPTAAHIFAAEEDVGGAR